MRRFVAQNRIKYRYFRQSGRSHPHGWNCTAAKGLRKDRRLPQMECQDFAVTPRRNRSITNMVRNISFIIFYRPK